MIVRLVCIYTTSILSSQPTKGQDTIKQFRDINTIKAITFPNFDTTIVGHLESRFIYLEPPFLCHDCYLTMLHTFNLPVVIYTKDAKSTWRNWWTETNKHGAKRKVLFTTDQVFYNKTDLSVITFINGHVVAYPYSLIFDKDGKPNKKLIRLLNRKF